MITAIDYLLNKGWKISSDPRTYSNYPNSYGLRNFTQNGINYDSFCSGYHRAFDLYSNETNDVPAVTSGTVITSEDYGNFGGTVEIRDSNNNDWIYGHLQRGSLRFVKGDKVNQGDIVGLQGSSNYNDVKMSVHLHLQLRPKGTNLSDEIAEVCSGIPIEKYDISKLNQKMNKTDNGVKKMKIMLVSGHGYNDPGAVGNGTNERDFIREQIVDRVAKYLKIAGHSVTLYSKNQDMYQDTAFGEFRPDRNKYGIFWVKKQGYDVVVEFHLDASANPEVDGGHVVIGAGLAPDKIDTGIQAAIDKHVDVVYGISKRDDLAHPRIAKAIGLNYRLVELGFITNKGDMDYMKKNGEAFCKDIADAINGSEIKVPGDLPQIDEVKTVIKTASKVKNPPKKNPFPLNKYRGRSLDAYVMGRIDGLGAEVRKRTGSRTKGFSFNTKAGYDLKHGDVVYIFETHDGWGRIYTGESSGKGSNDWIWLERLTIDKVFKN